MPKRLWYLLWHWCLWCWWRTFRGKLQIAATGITFFFWWVWGGGQHVHWGIGFEEDNNERSAGGSEGPIVIKPVDWVTNPTKRTNFCLIWDIWLWGWTAMFMNWWTRTKKGQKVLLFLSWQLCFGLWKRGPQFHLTLSLITTFCVANSPLPPASLAFFHDEEFLLFSVCHATTTPPPPPSMIPLTRGLERSECRQSYPCKYHCSQRGRFQKTHKIF